jgi:hypothetical protein
MEEIRDCFGFSFAEIEMMLLARLRASLGEGLLMVLQILDETLRRMRDGERFRVKGFEERTLETAMGTSVIFKRRQYFDTEKNRYVFLLDEALGLERYKQVSPLLGEMSLELAVNSSAYRKAAENLEAIQGHRPRNGSPKSPGSRPALRACPR